MGLTALLLRIVASGSLCMSCGPTDTQCLLLLVLRHGALASSLSHMEKTKRPLSVCTYIPSAPSDLVSGPDNDGPNTVRLGDAQGLQQRVPCRGASAMGPSC